MPFGNLLSPDAVKNAETNFAGEALRELNAQIVNEQTITVKSQIDAQTYDASKDFSKSREKFETDPITKEKAKKLVKKLVELKDYKAITAYLKENIATLDKKVLKEAIKIVVEKEVIANKTADNQGKKAAHYRMLMEKDSEYKSDYYSAIESEKKYDNKVSFYIGIESKLKKALAKKILTAASEKGVSDYREIPANSPLDSLVKRMKMEFKDAVKFGRPTISVFINNEDTEFYMTPEYFDYKIYAVADNDEKPNAIVIEKIRIKAGANSKVGDKSYKKFAIDEENSRVLEFFKDQNYPFEKVDSYPLPATTNSHEKVVQN